MRRARPYPTKEAWKRYEASIHAVEVEGAEAFKSLKATDANPYKIDDPRHAAWVRGWLSPDLSR